MIGVLGRKPFPLRNAAIPEMTSTSWSSTATNHARPGSHSRHQAKSNPAVTSGINTASAMGK